MRSYKFHGIPVLPLPSQAPYRWIIVTATQPDGAADYDCCPKADSLREANEMVREHLRLDQEEYHEHYPDSPPQRPDAELDRGWSQPQTPEELAADIAHDDEMVRRFRHLPFG